MYNQFQNLTFLPTAYQNRDRFGHLREITQRPEETAKGKRGSIVVRGKDDTLTSEPTIGKKILFSLMQDCKALIQL